MTTEALLQAIIEKSESFKAEQLVVRDVRGMCSYADFFVFMEGTSSTHIQSLSEAIMLMAKHQGHPAQSIEGLDAGEWCLLDFGDMIVHIFNPDKRQFFNLEKLWEEAPVVYPTAS